MDLRKRPDPAVKRDHSRSCEAGRLEESTAIDHCSSPVSWSCDFSHGVVTLIGFPFKYCCRPERNLVRICARWSRRGCPENRSRDHQDVVILSGAKDLLCLLMVWGAISFHVPDRSCFSFIVAGPLDSDTSHIQVSARLILYSLWVQRSRF